MIKKTITAVCLLMLICVSIFASTYDKIDSLKIDLAWAHEDTSKVTCNFLLAEAYMDHSLDTALYYVHQALNIAQREGLKKKEEEANFLIAIIFFHQTDFKNSIDYYLKALELMDTVSNRPQHFALYFNIGLIFQRIDNPQKSLEYYFEAQRIYDNYLTKGDYAATSTRYAIGRVYNNIGLSYYELENFSEAMNYYSKAITYSNTHGKTEALPYVFNNLGKFYQRQHKYDSAQVYYKKSLGLRQVFDDFKGTALTKSYIGDCYLLQGFPDKAIKEHNDALIIAKKYQMLDLQKDISESLIKAYAEIRNFEKAHVMHNQFKKLQDSLNLIESAKATSILEMQYNFEKQKREFEIEEQQRKFNNIVLISILSLIAIIVALLYFLTKGKLARVQLQKEKIRIENESLEDKLAIKNKDLAMKVMYMVGKNELINSIAKDLMKNRSNFKKVNQDFIQDIIVRLNNNIDSDIWKEFELRFVDVNEEFYKALSERFPNLSTNEKKLCAFLRLNMTTKEIAAITSQNVHAINIARSRLRKKLGIENSEESLTEFILAID